MKALVISGQDIHELVLGLIQEKSLEKQKAVQTNPEGYLRVIDETLKEWEVAIADIDAVVVVSGPGSFTASRVSVTIANALKFALALPLYVVENIERASLSELISKIDWEKPLSSSSFAKPIYDRPPHIT